MFIIEQLLFYLSIIFVLFLPGYFLILSIYGKNLKNKFSPLEKFIVSFGLSIVTVNFLIIILGKLGLVINKLSLILGIGSFLIACYLIYKNGSQKEIETKKTFSDFSKKQTALIIIILFLTIFVRSAYLKDTIFPTSTDLGHHMYWAKLVSQTGELPDYQKIVIGEDSADYEIQSEEIADFIIGEHLIFSAINILSGAEFLSYFPTLILLLINIVSILAIFLLTLRIFSKDFIENNPLLKSIRDPKNISIVLLFMIGPLYAIASPQAKFVSGGVIGNIIGNLLIPLSLYFYFRAFRSRDSRMMFLALFTSAGMFFVHHLSSLIFIFIFIFVLIVLIATLTIKSLYGEYKDSITNYLKVVFSIQNILFIIFISIFTFLIYTPSYLNADATGTAVGAPSKSTRTGLTLSQFKYAVGEPRLALGIVGIILLSIISLPKVNKKGHRLKDILVPAILIGWTLAVSLMTLKPHWLYINIPSGRVANYANFPFAISASLALVWIVYFVQTLEKSKLFLSRKIVIPFIALLALTFFSAGYYDNSQSLTESNNSQSALKTFHASEYLEKNSKYSQEKSVILKDHNYIKADAWIKLFFMEDYNFPLSRSFFKRYEDPTKPREMCTLWMIESPASEEAEKCYQETMTKLIMVNPNPDSVQFEKNNNFWRIYSGDKIDIFYKN